MNTIQREHKVIFVKRLANGDFRSHEITFIADDFRQGVLQLASEKYRDCFIVHPDYLCPITIDCNTSFVAETGRTIQCDAFGVTFDQLEQKLNEHYQGNEIGQAFCRIHRSKSGRVGEFIDCHLLDKRTSECGQAYADNTMFKDSGRYFK